MCGKEFCELLQAVTSKQASKQASKRGPRLLPCTCLRGKVSGATVSAAGGEAKRCRMHALGIVWAFALGLTVSECQLKASCVTAMIPTFWHDNGEETCVDRLPLKTHCTSVCLSE